MQNDRKQTIYRKTQTTQFKIAFLTLFLKILGLQGEVPNAVFVVVLSRFSHFITHRPGQSHSNSTVVWLSESIADFKVFLRLYGISEFSLTT
jgi:hypothetical protein